MRKQLLLSMACAFFTTTLVAQTTLKAGDIVVIQLQADAPDAFAFIPFVSLEAGTVIYFTDCGIDAATDQFKTPTCTEGAVKYTVPAGGISAGKIIRFTGASGNFSTYKDTKITGNMALSTSGDQLLVFQDKTNADGSATAALNPSFIYMLNIASTLFAGVNTDSNQTGLPSTLTSPTSALALGSGTGNEDEWDNVIYSGSYDFSASASYSQALIDAKKALENPTNYVKANTITDTTYSGLTSSMPTELNLPLLSVNSFLKDAFSIYPNPSNGEITIKNNEIPLEKISISDLNGRLIESYTMSGENTSITLDLKLTSGVYLLKLETKTQGFTTQKLVIE